jgi:N-acetyl-gamma-glutamyl-phosphate reductase
VIIDASTAHRVADGWTYGFPELCAEQKATRASSKRIANPGCYPTGMIALTRPLVDAGLLPRDTGLVVHAVSGFSGGGKQLMAIHADGERRTLGRVRVQLEAQAPARDGGVLRALGRKPIFCPAVGSFEQGMVVSVPLHYDQLRRGGHGRRRCTRASRISGTPDRKFVSVRALNDGRLWSAARSSGRTL